MSVKIKGSSATTYSALATYLAALSSVDEDNDVTVELQYPIDDIFDEVKRETIFRGRAAENAEGAGKLDIYSLTEDEEDYFLDKLEDGAKEVFQKLLAWAKGLTNAFQFNVDYGSGDIVTDETFGYPTYIDANALYKALCSPTCDDDGLVSITVAESLGIAPGELVGKNLYLYEDSTGDVVSEVMTILSNTKTKIYVEDNTDYSGFPITPTEYYAQYSLGFLVPIGEQSILYYLEINEDSRYDQLLGVDKAIQDALAWSVIKEWYRTNRLMEDYAVEDARYYQHLRDLRSHMLHIKDHGKRKGFFDHEQESADALEE